MGLPIHDSSKRAASVSTSANNNGYYNEFDQFYIRHPFALVFRYAGTVWPRVLPYCILNCAVLTALTLVQQYLSINISILPQGHALMSLLIAYLGVSKVNLAYERYMSAQIATGHAFMTLRELHQLALTLSKNFEGADAEEWRADTRHTVVQLIHETVATLRDGRHAGMLSRNVGYGGANLADYKGLAESGSRGSSGSGNDDPMILVHALRSHLYHDSIIALSSNITEEGGGTTTIIAELQLLERCKMIDLLHEFTVSYRNLLRLASTPMPFALVQMGRTFTFVWTLTIPFVLTGKDFVQEYPSAFSFVILLTYGFLGLEFVSRMLSNPFGDEIKNDLNIKGMGAAAIIGIERDSKLSKDGKSQRMQSATSGSLRKLVQVRQDSLRSTGRYVVLGGSSSALDDNAASYCAMGDGDMMDNPSVFT